MPSMGVQRMASQMIATPGFNSNNNSSSNQFCMNVESSNNVGGFSAVENLLWSSIVMLCTRKFLDNSSCLSHKTIFS